MTSLGHGQPGRLPRVLIGVDEVLSAVVHDPDLEPEPNLRFA